MATPLHPQAQQMMSLPTPSQSPSPSPLSILNPNPRRVPGPDLLHLLVRETSPDLLPAIDYLAADGSHETVSYFELHSRAETLARRLLAALPETQPADQFVVPLLLPQCPDLYISQLAVLKAGGAFCPLNLDAPPERVRFIFGDVSAKVVLTSQALRSRVDTLQSTVAVVVVDGDDTHDGPSSPNDLLPHHEINPDSLAYVMYTSGSTGTPKGVGISHSAAAQALLAHDRHIPHFSRFLQFAAPTFDVSVFEIFFPLFRGATLVSCDRADMLNDLPAVLRARKVDACELTPTVAGSLLRSREAAPGLRVLLTIGEMLTEPVIREFGGDADRSSMLWAMYGPTEATIHCTLQPACEAASLPNNVGFPLDTVSAFILDTQGDEGGSGKLQVLPLGEMGELAVGGYQTAVGYMNRPEQTTNVFIDSPYGRLYRTGDKARMRDDGTIECFGRIADGQVKLRGQRIELGEIEQAVLRTPGSHGAVASVVRGIIVVFCEQDAPAADAADEVLRACQDWLPAFMVPGDVILMETFPRLPSGKVDRKKLKTDYETAKGEDSETTDQFIDDVEKEMARLVEDALGIELKSSSILSAAGVDSLAAIKLASRLRQAGFAVDAIDVLSSKSLLQLRSRIRRGEQVTDGVARTENRLSETENSVVEEEGISSLASRLGVQAATIDAVLPCAPMQVSMITETLRNPEAYCNWIELKVPLIHAPETISAWFQELARCNEILRTGFVMLQGKYRQVVWKELDPNQIRPVRRLSQRYQLDEQGFIRPFSVQMLTNTSRKHTSVLLQIHHALYDGWSFDIALADLNCLARGGQAVNKPSFRLVSSYYNSPGFSRHADAARGYWAEYLLGFQPAPMPQLLAKQASSGQVFSAQRTLDVEASAIKSISEQLNVSQQVLFQACLLWLWGSILGTEDVVIGNVTSGRTIPVDGVENVMGPCLTAIPLRSRLSHVVTIKELLESIHASNRESLAHCTLPLADIKKAAGIAPGQQLYDALFVYQESIPSRLERQKRPGQIRQVAHEDYLETKLLAEIEPMERSFKLRVTYHADVFHYGYMQLLLRQFECVLAHTIKDVEAEVMSLAECFSENLLSTYNRTPKALKGCLDLATLFERTVAKHPAKTAICFAQSIDDDGADLEIISYGELNSLSNKIARLLRSRGASEEYPVAIIMEKSIMLYAGILGILKAGCGYLPLLPSTPKARIQTILNQADVRLCVSDKVSCDDLPELDKCQIISLRAARLEDHEDSNIGITTRPSRIANVIYTSGSTGVPKGVCVTQLNICSNLDVLSRIYPVKENSRMLQACSQAFDVSVFEILFALTRGMCLCAATNDVLFSDLERSIRVMDVTHLSMTPTVASLVNPENVPKVNFLVTSGEPMTAEVARMWMGKLYQGYGPSETTNICSAKKMTPEDHIRHLGHVFENTTVLVIAPGTLDVVPVGCAGELCFGGDQVVAGYLKLPSVTMQKFVQHPKFGRIYRSGDIGRMLSDGSLLIVGRADDQIKLRGQRVELGEINNVTAACGEVANCVTILVGQGSSQQLACFFVPKYVDGGKFQLLPAVGKVGRKREVIYSALRARLPGYMVPSYLVPISTVPMTSSGKVDKARLRDVFGNLGPRELQALGSDAEPADEAGDWSEEECKIAAVVADVLGVSLQDVRRWTPLTSLGLDSISAIVLSKGLQGVFSRRVPISVILQHPAVARLAAIITEQQVVAVMEKKRLDIFSYEFVERIRQYISDKKSFEIREILPCTPLQEAMLASSASDASYLNKMLFRLHIDAGLMRAYWSAMFHRHDILRTCFFSTNDREHAIAQCVLTVWEPEWMSFDATDGSLEDSIRKHVEAIPAAIDSGTPPISLAVIDEGEQQYLSFVCHHAMYDGVAISRLLEEIELVASGSELQPAPSYKSFLLEALSLPESTEKFWKQYLDKLRPISLPRAPTTQAGRDVLTQFLGIPFSKVDTILKTLNVSMLALVQASWSTLLRIILQSDDICFGNVVSGRSGTVDRIEELVAPCFNTIPTRIDFQGKKRNIDVMRSLQALNPELLQYQFTPLRRIQALCTTNGERLFDTLLLLQQAPRPLDKGLWTLEGDYGEMDFHLVCEVTPEPGRDLLEVKIHFDGSHVSSTFATLIHDTLSHIISTFLHFPSSHIISRTSLPSSLQTRFHALHLVHLVITSEEHQQHSDASESWYEPEKVIRSVLSKISKVKENIISRQMTVFQLGLDSINAVQVAAMLRKEGFPSITATDILENPSCAKLASKLATFQPNSDDIPQYDLAEFQRSASELLQQSVSDWDTVEAVLPCTSLQMGMLTEFMNSKGKNYLNFISCRVDPGITASRLAAAWISVAEANAILRMGFTPLDHEDVSFAMLQHKPAQKFTPIQTVDSNTFDAIAWKQDVAQALFNDLRRPPWRLVIVDGSAGVDMHLAIHHIIYDAHSLHAILSDLSKALRGDSLNHKTNISIILKDMLGQAQGGKRIAQAFWETQARTVVINKFPVMTPLREEKRDIIVKSQRCSLSFSVLEESLKDAGLTIQAVAQAAWLRILSSYLGETSVVFGTILSGRNSEATSDAVFPCITTLPVIAQRSSSNREILQSMMQYNTELQRNQRTPLTDIQRWLGHPSTKLFDTILVYQKFDHEGAQRSPWQITDEQATADYPVSVEIEPQGDSVELRVTFFSNVLPPKQAEILLRQFDAVFCDLVQNSDGSEDVLLKTHPELFAILPAEEPELKSEVQFLHELVEIIAQKHAEKTALEFLTSFENGQPVSRRWNFRELDGNGNRVAQLLAKHVKTGDIVAVCFDKCPEAHFAMLGILKAGCALLALDPGAPSSRKEFILQDSGAAVLLTDRPRSLDLGFKVKVPVIVVDEETMVTASAVPHKLTRPLSPHDRSYCLYTSGTTGTPKGCEITHENAVQAMLAFQKLFEGHWDQDSKWLQFASYHFDVSVLEQYWTWSVGITLVAAPRDVILEDLAGMISRLQITHIDLTPSLARLLHPDDVPSLCRGVFITGGEQLKQEILDVWGPKRVIHNFYGPTEATIGVTSYPCVPINGKSSNIGRQFPNVGSYVLHPGTDIPVVRGGVGELCVSGKLVGKGYLNRDELTAERFPILKAFNERVYRTGDLVRVLHDGCIDFLGRADDQVKLRGQRLEIGEINHCIRSSVPELNDVVTLVIRNEKQQKDLLVSFVVTPRHQKAEGLQVIGGDEAANLGHKVQRACRERLPGYMVPTYVFLLPFIPLSPNNKAEAKELRALFNKLSPEQLVTSSTASSVQLGEVGWKICTALSGMCSISKEIISPATNIFELGVDSISAMRLARSLKREGLMSATPAVILRNPTVADLSRALQHSHTSIEPSIGVLEARQAVEACQHRHRGIVCRTLGITTDLIEYIAPCSPLQHGMVSRSLTKGSEGAYFNEFRFELSEGVALEMLRSAWETLVKENSALRTKFVSTTEGYVQVAVKDSQILWEELKLQGADALEQVLTGRRSSWAKGNSQDILLPLEFLAITQGKKCLLVVHIFHGIYDANSLDLMVDKVARHYRDAGSTVQPPPSFLDALLYGPLRNHSASKDFWTAHFKGATSFPLPWILNLPSDEYLSVLRQVPFNTLDTVRKALGVTQQSIIQALWSTVLQRYFKSEVTSGIIISGRSIELENADKTIGPLFNTIPYHHRITPGQTWSSVIRKCHEFNTAIIPFQHVPLRDVQKWCSGGKPLFDNLFSFQRASHASDATHGLWKSIDSNVNTDYPLAFEATLRPDGELQVLIVAQKGVADEGILNEILDDFEGIATAVVKNSDGLVIPRQVDSISVDIQRGARELDEECQPSVQSASSIQWTPAAEAMRREIALLAGREELSLAFNTTLLELGLDSIDTIKLSARLRRAGFSLSNSQLIKGQSIESFVAMLQEKESEKGQVHDSGYSSDVDDPSDSLSKHLADNGHELAGIQQILPPTPLQDSMVLEMVHSDFQRYFNHDVLELSPEVDSQRLKDAWMTVVATSPILRTVFMEVASPDFDFAFAQLVLEDHWPDFGDVDILSLDEVPCLMEQARIKARDGQGCSNLLQLKIARSPQKVYLILSIAHALYDGWSLGLLHQDVQAAYHGAYAPREEYTSHLRSILRSSSDGAPEFWSDYVSDATPALLPSRHGGIESLVHRAEISLEISAPALKAFCRRHAISQQAVAQACWAAVLSSHCQRLDVTFGVVLSGRETEASEAMMFPTMNTVPVRAVFYGSVSSFLRYMQDNIASISQFQHYPLRKIQGLVKSKPGSLFNTLFIFQKNNLGGNTSPDSSNPLMNSVEGSSTVEYPVCVEMELTGDSITWRVACDDGYLSADQTSQLLRDLGGVLCFLINSADDNVLKFGDEGVSVCGLPEFRPSELQTSEQAQPGPADDDKGWSPTEQLIREVLAEMSGVETASISKSHNLYHLGLDSISAIKVSSALRNRGIAVTVREMIQAASIKAMAAKAPSSSSSTPEAAATDDSPQIILGRALESFELSKLLESADLDAAEVVETLPATAMQTHMLSVWQNTDGEVFFSEFRYRMSGIRNGGPIEKAWRVCMEEFPILRTIFLATGSCRTPFLQIVLRPRSEVENPFVKLNVWQQGDDGWIMGLRIQHALYDGVSLPLIMERFREALCGDTIQDSHEAQALSTWKSLLSPSLNRVTTTSLNSFWTTYLKDTESTLFPKDASATGSTSARVNLLRRAALTDTARLKTLCAEHGLGFQAFFLAAYAKALASLSAREGGRDVVFGVYLANRGTDDHRLPYPKLCLVPLRVKVPREFRVEVVASYIQRDLHRISAPENVSVGLWEIREWTGVVVDSFVNFLSLPGDPGGGRDSGSAGGAGSNVQLEEVGFDDVVLQERRDGVEGAVMSPGQLPWLKKNAVRDAYPDAVDIEASIQGGGALDIGVFGSGDKLGDNGAGELVEMMVSILSA